MTKFMKFLEWRAWMAKDIDPAEVVTCPVCEGEGTFIETCSQCDGEKDVDCEVCGQEGTVVFGELSKELQAKCFSFRDYQQRLIEDIELLQNWSDNPINLFADLRRIGYVGYQTIKDREIGLLDISNGGSRVSRFFLKYAPRNYRECSDQGH